MKTIYIIFGIFSFGFILNVTIRQTYNFIFLYARRPKLWIVAMALISTSAWTVSGAMGWGVSIPAWASTMAFLINLPPSSNKKGSHEAQRRIADNIYKEIGIDNGTRLYRIGLYTFFIFSILSWGLIYGEFVRLDEAH